MAEPAAAALVCPACYGFQQIGPRLHADPAMTEDARAMLRRTVAEAPARLALFFGATASTPVVLACAGAACQARIGAGGARGMAYGAFGLRLSPAGLDPVIVVHELTHIELAARLGLRRVAMGSVPAWFDEGVAVIVSDDPRHLDHNAAGVPRCRAGHDGPVPDDPRAFRHSGASAYPFYARAACRVLTWMNRAGGPRAIGHLVDSSAQGARFADLYGDKGGG
ncbi:hypothetical protein [Xanthobacter sp. KR7-225]|uniref:hypothetical protein n=1 Tax=Xanthobacter sp. KR7-225 TaxID=3156613 RepID=UPI0032B39DC1